MAMMELAETDTRWTEESRESFRTAAANLVEAIRQHSAALLELTGSGTDTDTDSGTGTGTDADSVTALIAEADEHLAAVASAYADAQFAFTGTVPPLGLDEEDDYSYDEDGDEADLELDEYDDEYDDDPEVDELEDDDEEPELEELGEPALKLTVLHRADFVVTDGPAVVQAGKEAQHEALDGEPAGPAGPTEVDELGEALRLLHGTGGLEALADTPGLVSAGATTWILEATDLLDERDPEDWPASPFTPGEDAAQRLLHRLDEVAG